ncbi:binding-protein-dependent transport systems inner membrane component [Thermoanaerobacter mathranii subsp. mathranii str. A3]|uniref:Binding-protein-dependent transport systems inner membrane component n=3 Tax=Thermoanaerobacter TaxID=1754 RepID=D3T3Y6_THEIA|nr:MULTISPECIES: carbohydrate ABC transporter permease [Thermoanaerobacter]ADD02938.1 binding-protein-dependent transport systems inner membrane component [Thermoanaerobacter italicus Ab9]ADH61379.1 binding-protein-dependent transport systems inner membrane component [Thermoanaerobacter mathranii subsp. mathranii str. A3]MDP9750440.1 raffinose/stachyose/melibiose transport system permease protein [Thermoanaerobacter pentosaceus]
MEKNNRLLNGIKFFALSVFLVLYIFPFFIVLINSFKERKEILQNPLKLSSALNLSNYIDAFTKMNYMHAFLNSLIITAFSVFLITLLSSMTAYIFVRKKWKFNQFMFFFMVASMIIPFQGIMIPLVKIYGSIGMMNSKWALIYMYVGFGASLAVFMYHGFIKSIPLELEEAAMIDGAGQLKTFFTIVFPLLKPVTTTIAILDILWIWNDFLLPYLVLMAPEQRTLPLSVFYFYGTYTIEYGPAMAALMLATIPVIIAYLLMQKQIIEGVLKGSIK